MQTNETADNQALHVVIIGGGITGLAAAYHLQELSQEKDVPIRYTLLEGSDRLGGKILTERVDGFTIEGGPDCFIRQKPWAAHLAQRLGLSAELLGTNDDRRKTYVLNHGKLTPLPDGVMLIIPTRIMPFVTSGLISWPGKIRMGMDLFIPRRKDDADESVGDFVRRRLGREALDKIAEPLMGGIHVSDPEQQSLLGTFPRFRRLEEQHRSLILGMLAQRRASKTGAAQPGSNGSSNGQPASLFVSLRGGLGQLVEALTGALTGDVRTGCTAAGLERLPDGRYEVLTETGERLTADAVILATPAYVSAGLVNHILPDAARFLSGIRYVSTATISLAYRKSDVANPLKGFGFVVPRKEKRDISACTWSSTKFDYRAPEDGVLLRCFIGGPGQEELVGRSDAEVESMARAELARLMGLHAGPLFTRVYRWRKANPQYDVGHLDRVKQIRELTSRLPGLFIAGSAFDGVGVPDCIHQGEEAAERILDLR